MPALPGFTVEVVPELASTNTELMRRCREATRQGLSPDAVLLVAEQQTAGRGRLGRTWHSQAGHSLTFSLGMPLAPHDWSGLSLAVGVSLAESLDPTGGHLQLKWPNDVWLDGRKLAGILVETASWGGERYVVIGVGINVLPADDLLVAGGAATTSLAALAAGMDAPTALLAVATPLVRAVQAFEALGFAAFAARFAARDALAGRSVTLSDGTLGTAHGVGESGALLVLTASGMQAINSLEVSVRPVGAPEAGGPP